MRARIGVTASLRAEGEHIEVLVQHRSSASAGGVGRTKLTYARHPFDVMGWDGCLYPYALNIDPYAFEHRRLRAGGDEVRAEPEVTWSGRSA